MKEKDLHIEYDTQQIIMFVEKEDGTYGPLQTGAYMVKNYIDDFWFKKKNLEKELVSKLKEAQISPVYYYMLLEELSVAELASRVGIRRSRVKRHFKPKYFKRIKLSLLQRYAEVFGIPVSNMLQVIVIKQNDEYKSYFIKDEELKGVDIKQNKTKNPLLVVTKIEGKL